MAICLVCFWLRFLRGESFFFRRFGLFLLRVGSFLVFIRLGFYFIGIRRVVFSLVYFCLIEGSWGGGILFSFLGFK